MLSYLEFEKPVGELDARIAELRAALAAGTVRIEPEKIAQAMVQDMFSF